MRALITGITGQDGSYLAELLLSKGYEVHGIIRRSSSFNTGRLEGIFEDPHKEDRRLFLHYGDLLDGESIRRILKLSEPQEIYNLAAQSHVRVSFDVPQYTKMVNFLGARELFRSAREIVPDAKIYQASSSEMFGNSQSETQSESTPLSPVSPYGEAKMMVHFDAPSFGSRVWRGILFNHESPRRGETFVSRKICRAVARIKSGIQKSIYLGNLNASRDWGYAPEYVEAMWKMLQQDDPREYVIATGETHSVEEFASRAFSRVGLDYKEFVRVDKNYFRETELNSLCGNAQRAGEELGWGPRVRFNELVDLMVDSEVEALKGRETCPTH